MAKVARASYLFSPNISQALGGTGNLPVPPGYQPGGSTTSSFSLRISSSRQGARPSLVGKLPTRTGW